MLRHGEWLLVASDGVTEAEDIAGNQLGDSGLNAVAHHVSMPSSTTSKTFRPQIQLKMTVLC
jgi:hypothetical protein